MQTITSADLERFTGTEQYYKNTMSGLKNTDGVQFLAEKAGAFWLIDAIASYQGDSKVKAEEFQLWELTVENSKGVLTMKSDTDQPLIITQDIVFTDFPLPVVKFYLCNGVLMLPSEY